MNEPTPRRGIKSFSSIISMFRALDPLLSIQVIDVFLEVARARDGEIETRDLPDRVGLSQSSTNRALTYLAEHDWKDKSKPGLGLIEHHVSTMDRRQRLARLTGKGKMLVKKIEEAYS